MKIAVTSQNFSTITQHAGKSRRFLIFECNPATGRAQDVEFGFAEDGTLVIFQVRRVVSVRRN